MRTLARPRDLARRPVRSLLSHWPLAVGDDVDGIHQTRVASRRLRELVPVLAEAANADALRLRRRLRDVTRLLGRSRELDVTLETLGGLETCRPSRADAVEMVRRHIGHERSGAGREMRHAAAEIDIEDLAAATRDLALRLSAPRAVRACARRAAARLGRRARQLEQAVLRAGLMFAPGPLHRVRIALKKFRYALEVAEHLGRFRLSGSMQRLKRMQDLLGELHDLQVAAGHVRDVVALSSGPERHDLEALVDDIDDAVRALHGRFVAERGSFVPLLARAASVRRVLAALPAPASPAVLARAAARLRARIMEEP